MKTDRLRLVIYTVLVGDKEALNDPLLLIGNQTASDIDIEYVCFTDRSDLESPTWNFRFFNKSLIPAEKASRHPKALPHRYFDSHEYSLYIDNTVVLKRLPTRADIEGVLFSGFRHPWRSNPVDEADIVVRSGLDEAGVVARQMNFYSRASAVNELKVLTAGTVLLRRHADPAVQRFGEMWWEQILLFSKRDQLSLDLCAEEAGCPVNYFPGDKTSNDLFLWPVIAGGVRVQGSFDAELYAWQHRTDPAARENPRRHFLAHAGSADGERYVRHVGWFAYACERAASGLGGAASPRRNLAPVIEPLLAAQGDSLGSVLIIGVRSADELSVESEELLAAQAALLRYFRYARQPDVVTAEVSADDVLAPEPFRGAAGKAGFSLVLVLGMTPPCHAGALAKFLPLMRADGVMLLEFTAGLSVPEMTRLHAAIGHRGKLEVFHASHILRPAVIPGSVFVLTALA